LHVVQCWVVESGTPAREHGRERRKRATRQALRTATLELGLERGLPQVSVEEIAERAGVSTRTFFNYFDTKEDAALIELFTAADLGLPAVAAGEPGQGLWTELTRLFADDVERAGQDGPDLPRYMELHERHPALQARQLGRFAQFEGRLADAIARRTADRPDGRLRADVMSGSCITAVRVGLQHWGRAGGRGSARGFVEAAFATFEPAFRDDV
jgi:AcrR family transcriptional regulator